jgi:archaeosine-15-forming tRNA-guanine transglycosylase
MIIQHHTNANLRAAIRQCTNDLLYSKRGASTIIRCTLTPEMRKYISQQLTEYCDIEPIFFELRQSLRSLYFVQVKHL